MMSDTKKIYLDNGSTSFPKAPGLGDAMGKFISEAACNVGRGAYASAYSTAQMVYDVREALCRLFCFQPVKNVVFTPNVTYSLNYVIQGMARKGDHVIISGVDHNAVARPCEKLQREGRITYDVARCFADGRLDLDHFTSLIRPQTRMVVMTHASNVAGTILPAEEVGKICAERGIYFVLDAAQSAGVIPIDFAKLHLSALCLTGHKSLLGPQGIGAVLMDEAFAGALDPLICGGTGSASDLLTMPDFMPDKFEAGTLNLPGIIGLGHALSYLQQEGIETIRQKEQRLVSLFLDGLRQLKQVRIVGLPGAEGRTGVVSLDFPGQDNAEIAYRLDDEYGIMTRCGLHCAPLAHQSLGTFPQGTVRFAFGYFTTEDEVFRALCAIRELTDVK